MTLDPPDVFLDGARAIVGADHVIDDPAGMEGHMVEWRGLYHGRARAVVKPATTEEVAALVTLCGRLGVAIVPQGGNTGLVGGQIPDEGGRAIVLSTVRMRRVRALDPASNTLVVEAGATLAEVQAAADAADRLFPLSLASEGSCTIGGNLATNAGGTAVLAYGNTRDLVLGLEVVMADGRVMRNLSGLRKDNTGYDLKNLFVGSEGTLGLITAVTLKLFPKPRGVATAFVALADPAGALALLALARSHAGGELTSFELISRRCIDFVLAHVPGTRDPLGEAHPWYGLIELSSQNDVVEPLLEGLLTAAFEAGIVSDASLAASGDQRTAFWRLREEVSDVQRAEGGSIKHDVSLPIAAVPDFLVAADQAVERCIPGARVVAFGHLGDGNIHYNVSQPVGADKAAFIARWHELNAAVHACVLERGGSVSAEHGIGQLKRDLLAQVKDPVALAAMRAIKAALDPKGLFNPGKVL